MKTQISYYCNRCYKSKEILGNYVCDKAREEACVAALKLQGGYKHGRNKN